VEAGIEPFAGYRAAKFGANPDQNATVSIGAWR
jgi:hypothetical protein